MAFFGLAANLRAPLTSLPPVISLLQNDLGIGQGMAGALTTIPVLCFGIVTPLAAFVLSRISIERAVFITLWGIVLGSALRSADGIGMVMTGTLVIGVALTFGNIVSLLVIARDFYERRTIMTGVLVSAMSVGAMLTSAFTAPLAPLLGWRFALGVWGVLALAAVALWVIENRLPRPSGRAASATNRSTAQPPPPPVRPRSPARRPVAWLLALAFAAHTFMFYGLTAWLPDYLSGTIGISATTAGVAESMFQILALLGCFGVPWLSSRLHLSHRVLFLGVAGAWFVMAVGVFAIPGLWLVWTVFGGIGGGGGFVVIFTLIMDHAVDLDDNRGLSSFVQGLGYIVASTSPIVLGVLHQWSGAWRTPFALLAVVAVAMAISGMVAAGLGRGSLGQPAGHRGSSGIAP